MSADTATSPKPTFAEAGNNYAVAQSAYQLSKTGWMKLRTYPVLSTTMPMVEATTAYTLEKVGLPEFEKMESTYIKPTLAKCDEAYLDYAIDTTVKAYDTTKTKTVEVYDATLETVSSTFETGKATVAGAYEKTAVVVVDTVDLAKAKTMDGVNYAKSFVVAVEQPESTTAAN